jgi:hypothetical protein
VRWWSTLAIVNVLAEATRDFRNSPAEEEDDDDRCYYQPMKDTEDVHE